MTGVADQDWYRVLGLAPDATTEQITAELEKRSRQASALANTSPERSQRLRDEVRAIKRDLGSVEARRAYDARREATPREDDSAQRTTPRAVRGTEPVRQPVRESIREQVVAPHTAGAAEVPAVADAAGQPASAGPSAGVAIHYSPEGQPYAIDQYGRPYWCDAYGRPLPKSSTQRAATYACRRCGGAHQMLDRYCVNCGDKLRAGRYRMVADPNLHPDSCPYCGTVAQDGHRFCRNCGAARPTTS